ncbi:MAG: hypothetical protein H6977_00670 [Gammaproteobacteria bacterium]|nr:hypothetical protein [Gammaproteobacteria bacterium]
MRFEKHTHIKTPHGSSIIWRYMGLDKFLDLLINERLYFTNAANFSDGYEVSLPPNIVKSKRKELEESGFDGKELEAALAKFETANNPQRELTLVNCWSLGRDESYALWKIYLGGARDGVAIRTNFSRLRKSINGAENEHPETIFAGEVQYRDYLPETDLSRHRLVTTKREFYRYENELRLFILHNPNSNPGYTPPYDVSQGRHVRTNVNLLIDEIYISPFAASWFIGALSETIKRLKPHLESKIRASQIRDQ